MANAAVETDILIAGAGPVGLFLANECARRGLRFRIVETRPTQSLHSKALAIFPRTLEILDMAGLVDPFLAQGNRVNSAAIRTHGRALAQLKFAPEESPYPFIAMVPQDVTERLLVTQLQRLGAEVEYETTLMSAVQQGDCVEATLNREGKTTKVRAAFVVGCDGAHSAVRHLLNLPFQGKQYDSAFMLADVDTNDARAAHELQLCPHESGPVALFPMSGTRQRIVATVNSHEGDAPSLEFVRKLLAERGPGGIEVRALHWSSYFRVHHRQVARLRVGRIFVAGDAAHIHSPFGGQGMNTGLQDVWNLVWKLDLAVRGRATEELLDSYTAERRPVIKSVIRTTDLLTKAMATPNKLAQALRNTLIPIVSKLPSFQHAFVNRLSGLGIRYRHSPIIEGAGGRYFDDALRGGEGIGSRFLLMIAPDAGGAIDPATRGFAESFSDAVELRSVIGCDTVLVRPDGYIAYSDGIADHDVALACMRALLQRQLGGPTPNASPPAMHSAYLSASNPPANNHPTTAI